MNWGCKNCNTFELKAGIKLKAIFYKIEICYNKKNHNLEHNRFWGLVL